MTDSERLLKAFTKNSFQLIGIDIRQTLSPSCIISIETMVILDDFLGFTTKFDKYYDNDIIWSKISTKINRYRPFLKYDKDKMKDILKGIVNEQRQTTKEISTKE